MTSAWLRNELLRCLKCGEIIQHDTPRAVWVNTGKCRACLIGRAANRDAEFCSNAALRATLLRPDER